MPSDSFDYDFSVADEQRGAKRDLLAKLEEDDFRWVMGTPKGRRFVWSLLSATGMYQTSYVAGDSGGTAFREGRRNLGLMLLAKIDQWCPENFVKMYNEHLELQNETGA